MPPIMSDKLSSDLASLRIDRSEDDRPKRHWARLIAYVGASVAAIVIVFSVVLPKLQASIFKTEVEFTEVSSISPVQASVQLTASGYVVPLTLSRVAAKIPGRIARSFVVEGQDVKAGSILFELEIAEQKASLAAAHAQVLAAQSRAATAGAQVKEIEQQLQREQQLAQRGVTAKALTQDLQARLASLQAAVSAAHAEAKVATANVQVNKATLELSTIIAPISGRVITKPPVVGDLVGPTNGPIIEIADFASLVMEVDVPEGRLHLVKLGAPCEIVLDAFPGRRSRGVIAEISNRINRAKATVAIRAKFSDATNGILPDMAGRLNVLSKPLEDNALKQAEKAIIPTDAIVERDGKKVVFIVDNDTVRAVPIRVGAAIGSAVELIEGPSVGTKLVKNPPKILATGHRVKSREE